ncbi:hypothetical protein SE18_21590 [Herpetosiphon geysericola]|uniref:Uncharacterized protein n=1 Tax=Herpetosiphon geysericola TaxID=70996 RepID=A0A0P6Y754_9CHLR|nr:hypothetical protein SE18_21590 [Herpetosiphon geysericola]
MLLSAIQAMAERNLSVCRKCHKRKPIKGINMTALCLVSKAAPSVAPTAHGHQGFGCGSSNSHSSIAHNSHSNGSFETKTE